MATHAAVIGDINPHLGLLASESYVSPGERGWYEFVRQVEKRLGFGLDGNQQTDGFSLDYAHAAFEAHVTPTEYVAEVYEDIAGLDAAFGPLLAYPRKSRF